jgi:hypothetical protein
MHSIDTNRTPIDTNRIPIVAGVALDGIGWWVVQLFYCENVADFFWGAASATLVAPLLLLDLLPPPLGVAKRNKLTNKKQGKGKKQILIGQRAKRINWGAASVNCGSASVNTSHHTVKK